jgi:recombination protein RecA
VRLDLRKVESIKRGSEVVGNRVRVKVVKNKVATPFKTAEFDLLFDSGISREGDLLDLGVELGLIKKMGTFFSYQDTRIGQGRENAREFLRHHPELAQEIEQGVRNSYPGSQTPQTTTGESPE